MASTFFTTRDTRTYEKEALCLEFLGTADGIGVVRVSSVDNDVTGLKVRNELSNEIVDCLTGLDEKDNFAGPLELGTELLDRVSALNLGAYDRI